MNNDHMNTEPIWKSWFARHGAKLLLFARQQSRRPDEAEDLLQEAFVRIWRLYGHTGEVSPDWFTVQSAGLRLTGHGALTGGIRENKVALDSPLSFSFERTLEQDERKQALLRAVERLPDQQKEVLILKIWGELTFDEIARTLDESLNTVASRYRYGLQKLRDWVPEEMEGKKGESSNAS